MNNTRERLSTLFVTGEEEEEEEEEEEATFDRKRIRKACIKNLDEIYSVTKKKDSTRKKLLLVLILEQLVNEF